MLDAPGNVNNVLFMNPPVSTNSTEAVKSPFADNEIPEPAVRAETALALVK